MTTEQIFTSVIIILTTINAGITFFNLKFSRRKDFQDKLFQIKLDAFNEMNMACYEATKFLSTNCSPFAEIYKIEEKKDWEIYFQETISVEYHKYFDLQNLTYKYSLVLPPKVVDQYHEFTNRCLSYITMSFHFDAGLLIDSQDKLWENYINLLNEFRGDLKIEKIDGGLRNRLSSKI